MKERLIKAATEARERAYSPYSHFCVGAALLASDGEIFAGVNIENGSYGATICAERSAFAAAISAGKRDFKAIAVVGAPAGKNSDKLCLPCGICRQFMLEFCSESFEIILFDGQNIVTKTLGELLPEGFTL